ncbi:MAG: hypothetical protein K9N46_16360 [Candidatus Marinimicrobia bacterium]|nr:hypothetical protein [Candidatus Neomarinimicrobiota bacterium]MCF7830327.1 hypothetical protein [Candidatus Neomarinimicrobiota bacterium]MCF7882304.1 hypothetical protein [Candidatus Neomarinimicrobiota bacterium]
MEYLTTLLEPVFDLQADSILRQISILLNSHLRREPSEDEIGDHFSLEQISRREWKGIWDENPIFKLKATNAPFAKSHYFNLELIPLRKS